MLGVCRGSRLPMAQRLALRCASRPAGGLSARLPVATPPLARAPSTAHATVRGFRSTAAAAGKDADEQATAEKSSGGGFLSAESSYADPSFTNRWAMAVPAFLTHMAIGAPWAWSVLSGIVTNEAGFVTSAASDWGMMEVTMPMSIVFAMQGIIAATMGKWQMKVGPRAAMATSALAFGGGMALSGLGVAMHSLPLVYTGYGVLAGTGVGLAYTPPVQALLEWFPDRRAVASGLTIAGFGSGSLVAAPLQTKLVQYFAEMPTYLGPSPQVATSVKDGKLFADVSGQLQEVVVATASDLNKLPYDGLLEGVYVVGSGNTGVAATLYTMGAGYFGVMMLAALAMRRPAPGYVPVGWTPPEPGSSPVSGPPGNVHVDTVMKTPQFRALATTFFCVACGGMGLFSVAKPMMSEIFSSTLPAIVTSSFASGYVLALSAGNLGGRLGWAAVSDAIGRRSTFNIFTMASIPLYLSVPYFIHTVVDSGSAMGLWAFIGATSVAVTIMGGVYAVLPAYESDLFGMKYVGANHGRMLVASTGAALAGPSLLVYLRSSAESKAIYGLLDQVDPARFQAAFGESIDNAAALVDSKAVTVAKLMAIAPDGVADPSPYIYDTTMYAMAGLMTVAAIAHSRVRPVDPKYFEVVEDATAKAKDAAASK